MCGLRVACVGMYKSPMGDVHVCMVPSWFCIACGHARFSFVLHVWDQQSGATERAVAQPIPLGIF